ncbi:MAG TPA: TonB-dependent receptor plug domain-containing protein [Longimicrobium sp.]|jgi:outer membrane cobalamin receptor
MKTLFPAFLSLALFAPAAQGQADTLTARRDTVVPGAARLAAARTIPEMLAARVPGLQVRPGSGAVASGSRLRLRGASGILVPGEPLVVVDGVRVVSEPNDLLAEVDQAPSRLDDFLPDDVERVEVLSGPAAIARYGPEGVNGVVEVFTRRGTRGRPRFHGFAEAGARSDVAAYPANFGRVGLGSDGTRTTACSLNMQAFGRCTPRGDSLLSFNPLEEASPFRTGGTRRVGGSVAGGVGPLTYSAGGSAERDLGVLRRDSRERTGARGSFTLRPTAGVEVAGSAIHLRNTLELPEEGATLYGNLFNGLGGNPFDDPVRRGYADLTQAERDTLGVTQHARRTLAGASVRWDALPWLRVGGRYGIDDVAAEEVPHYHYEDPQFRLVSQTLETERTRRNADVFARAEYTLADEIQLSTTLGAERTSARMHTLEEARASSGAFSAEETWRRSRSTAFFARQGLSWGRVGGSLSLRRDEPLTLPEPIFSGAASAAWEVPLERFRWLDGLRLRAAYARTEQDPENAFAAVGVIPLCPPGGCTEEERIGPQRHAELEGGLDAALLRGRVELSLTGYGRRAEDVLAVTTVAFGPRIFNSGRVVNRGVEARLRVGAPAGAPLSWELVGTGALNRNRLEDYDGPRTVHGPGQVTTDGNPVGSFFGPRITSFQDRNGDGIISRVGCANTGNQPACEIQYGEAEYLGPADPTRMLGVQGRVGWRGVELSALLDHQGGMRRANQLDRQRCSGFVVTCQAAFDPSTPLEDQARVVAYGLVPGYTYVEDASFTRLREAAVTLSIPERWARRFGGSGAELTLAGRNLALWTPYSGLDPETSSAGQHPILFAESFTQPLPRTLTTRLDVRF